eukprot:1537048-Alexandrium_andersonii.AAC.1
MSTRSEGSMFLVAEAFWRNFASSSATSNLAPMSTQPLAICRESVDAVIDAASSQRTGQPGG